MIHNVGFGCMHIRQNHNCTVYDKLIIFGSIYVNTYYVWNQLEVDQ